MSHGVLHRLLIFQIVVALLRTEQIGIAMMQIVYHLCLRHRVLKAGTKTIGVVAHHFDAAFGHWLRHADGAVGMQLAHTQQQSAKAPEPFLRTGNEPRNHKSKSGDSQEWEQKTQRHLPPEGMGIDIAAKCRQQQHNYQQYIENQQ